MRASKQFSNSRGLTAGKGTAVAGSLLLIAGCGGGGGGGGNGVPPADLATAEQLARATAAVLAAYHSHNEIHFDAADDLYINPNGTVACSTSGSLTVGGKAAPDSEDGTISYASCNRSANRRRQGGLSMTCFAGTDCGRMNATASSLSREYLPAGGLKVTLDGTYSYDGVTPVLPVWESETYQGKATFMRNGLQSTLSLISPLLVDSMNTGLKRVEGSVAMEHGAATGCLDGAFSFKSTTGLNSPALIGGGFKTTSGVLEFKTNSTLAGTTTFMADGSLSVKLASAASAVTIPYSQLETYCSLKQTYELLNGL